MSLFGAHVSIAGGIYKAPLRGEELGCDAIQVFTKNQMQWSAKPIVDEDAKKFKECMESRRPSSVMTHDSYLINLGSPEDDNLEKSRDAFKNEIDRCHQLGIDLLIFHPGSHLGAGEQHAIDTIADSLNWAHKETPGASVITLLEIAAGQGTNVGYTYEQLMEIMENVKDKSRVGICMDTCHMFSAGYDIRTKNTYEQTWTEFEKVIGFDWLKAFHVNDSKKPYNSRVDRHENLGNGYIGLEAFRLLLNDERFTDIPMVLETPGGDDWFMKNLEAMRGLVGQTSEATGPAIDEN
ncbi:MAG: deoxyribonuclease IV [Candidatus Marinimicrobia bacterium]|nr:deoxyribonuclease IV [Candidatus Neomarinimicrobiota bacterium]MCF7828408.1 deoxyribonuclease IV [Candidatus Neomarinimicrobiota bacterium]MCF7880998.1 deoxyribonuclease IV [Candidatus Neomarinimicrobiota bacterium]